MKSPKVPKPLRHTFAVDNLKTLLDACQILRDRLIVSLLADTGVRMSELAGIEVADIDLDSQIIHIWGKRAKQRVARYGPVTANILVEYLTSHCNGSSHFDIAAWGVTQMLKRLEHETGIKCNAYACRRAFATESVRGGLNVS